jgi:hypothetical protein
MIYLLAARADAFFPARARRADLGFAEVARLAALRVAVLFFSAPPRLRGEGFPSPTSAARTHTTGGSPSMIVRHDFPSSLEP